MLVNYVCTTPAFSTARQHIIFEDKTPYHNIPQVVVQYRLRAILVGRDCHKFFAVIDLHQFNKIKNLSLFVNEWACISR